MEMKEVKEQIKEKIDRLAQEGINSSNLDVFGKLIDIHKDIENEEYWKIKEEVMKDEKIRNI